MRRYMVTKWELSECDWEYAGIIDITSKKMPEQVDSFTLNVDGVKLEFDEEVRFVEIVKR